ncbi:ADP-ribosyl-[dinitrogen reductase] hydrolase [Paenibacillus sp. UNCCL117]|uniref:ADP-ribosylglycohydrolase family protein n=1 Tax=unclassified Paenibacillus TaxID=185978 RepID=UPI0008920D1D|nr:MULTISPECIES: ADP-ribosylglycohydrolase family protein [unclassified Paenibacillus]SDD69760.1 ADP-ribosyl-[dinitrogen reductase] hydrolase [Paenibacillus sp. cl123]SFW45204.1 ADP-ribosyl-[dinitrogen reductase] hydrolase [Paenibacillus sp. UNCCL117]
MELSQRIKGALYGVAVGDALGGTTEFMSRQEIAKRHGYLRTIIGGGVWNLEAGEVTDDTMMTLCVAEGILEHPEDPVQPIGERFMVWYRSDPKDIGNIIRQVFQRYEGNWFEAALAAHHDLGRSAGNGSLMRCLPAALAYADPAQLENVSRLQSRMTHYDERCDQACICYNRIAWRLLRGEELRAAIAAEIAGTDYADVLTLAGEPDCEPSGFVADTFRWVLYLLLHGQSFADVVQRAANLGGDSDTIGAIAGGLAGAYYGYEGIPGEYAGAILIRGRLDAAVAGICKLRLGSGGTV